MSLRYRVERAEEGAIVDPSPTNLNENELAAEINGHLDRHNLVAGGVGASSINVGTFTTLGSDWSTTDFTVDATTTAPQTVHSVTFSVTQDCQIEVDWSATWTNLVYVIVPTYAAAMCFEVRINGQIVAMSGWLYIAYNSNSVALNGTAPVQAGTVTITVTVTNANVGIFYGAGTSSTNTSLFQVVGTGGTGSTIKERELVYEVRTR